MIANIIVIDCAFTLDRRLRLILTGPVVSLCPGWENVDSIDDGEDGGRWDGDDTNDDQDRCAPAQLHPDSRGRRGRRGFWETSGSLSIAPCSIKIFLLPEDLKQFPSLTKAPLSLFHLILSLKKLISWLFLCLLFVCFPGRANGDSARLGGISPPRKTRSSRSKRTRGGFSQRSASCFLKEARDLHSPEEPEVL